MDKMSLTNAPFLLLLKAQSQIILCCYVIWRAPRRNPWDKISFWTSLGSCPFPLQSFNLQSVANWLLQLWLLLTHLISRWVNSCRSDWDPILETLSGHLKFPKTVTIVYGYSLYPVINIRNGMVCIHPKKWSGMYKAVDNG